MCTRAKQANVYWYHEPPFPVTLIATSVWESSVERVLKKHLRRSPLIRTCITGSHTIAMEPLYTESTLHLKWRIDARDDKLNAREEELADRNGTDQRVSKCNICVGEVRSTRKRGNVMYHLQRFGRSPMLRGSTEVWFSNSTEWSVLLQREFLSIGTWSIHMIGPTTAMSM